MSTPVLSTVEKHRVDPRPAHSHTSHNLGEGDSYVMIPMTEEAGWFSEEAGKRGGRLLSGSSLGREPLPPV